MEFNKNTTEISHKRLILQTHTFNDGYYCKIDQNPLNDKKENRMRFCEIKNIWFICDDCENFRNKRIYD